MAGRLLHALHTRWAALAPRQRRQWRQRGLLIVLWLGVLGYSLPYWPAQSQPPALGERLQCRVQTVHDGDTVSLDCPGGRRKVRLHGIDAPELAQAPWGEQARQALAALLPAQVTVEVLDTDRYGRTVARLRAGDTDLGLELVRQGRAVVYERYNRAAEYRQAQAEARQARRGIWAESGAQQSPERWRHLNPR
ncbi:MAG TPA: thermonuclease family protein [Candidatus Competibacteraceae bacterium]|nr:thermonuclease family protein [Candidatus Competibacteraceae bacterium]